MGGFAWYAGVDFSGAKEPLSNLWTAIGAMEEGKLTIRALRPHAFRADLCAYVAGGWRHRAGAAEDERILWGVDFPFGLPAPATRHLSGNGAPDWPSLLAWVADRPASEVRDGIPDDLRTPRCTDTGGAMSPFDLRLFKQTVEGLRWLHELREMADVAILPQEPAEDATTTLIEVYPSGAAQELGLPRRRAPARPGETRARAAALRTFVQFADPGLEAIAVTLEDAWDATIACICACLSRDDLDQPFRASSHPESTLRVEGWIYRPPASLP
jgi:hypothetical protein